MLPDWKPFAINPGRKKVALVGFSSSTRDAAPYDDPSYELWGMNQSYLHFKREPDRWFEIHVADQREDPEVPAYLSDLKDLGCPVYTVDRDPTIPTSIRYPLERVVEGLPAYYRRFFTSSAAYMVALAIAEGFETIALYGIDCAIGTEYETQKPCLEAWLSLAIGRGIEVIVPSASALFKIPFLYGYEKPKAWPRVLKASEKFLLDRVTAFQLKHNEALEMVHKYEGAIEELNTLLSFAESASRGTKFPTVEGTDE